MATLKTSPRPRMAATPSKDTDDLPGLPFGRKKMMELLEEGRRQSEEAMKVVQAMGVLDDKTLRRPLR